MVRKRKRLLQRKSRKRQERGREAVEARTTNPVNVCMLCSSLIKGTQRLPNQVGKVQPCGCTFHYKCLRKDVLCCQVIEHQEYSQCSQCQTPCVSIEQWGESNRVREQLLPLLVSHDHAVHIRQHSSMWDINIAMSDDDVQESDRDILEPAQRRVRQEKFKRHMVEHQEHEWRDGQLATLRDLGLVAELEDDQHVRHLGAILHHTRLNKIGVSACAAPRECQPLSTVARHLTDHKYHPEGVQDLILAGFPCVSLCCGSDKRLPEERREAISFVLCRLVMAGAAAPKCAGKLLKPEKWQLWLNTHR